MKTTCPNYKHGRAPSLTIFTAFGVNKCSLIPSERNVSAFLLVLILNGPRNARRKSLLLRCSKWSVNSWHRWRLTEPQSLWPQIYFPSSSMAVDNTEELTGSIKWAKGQTDPCHALSACRAHTRYLSLLTAILTPTYPTVLPLIWTSVLFFPSPLYFFSYQSLFKALMVRNMRDTEPGGPSFLFLVPFSVSCLPYKTW